MVFLALFRWATRCCFIYDLKREKEYGETNEYEFLDPKPYFPLFFRPLNKIAQKVETKTRNNIAKLNESDNKK